MFLIAWMEISACTCTELMSVNSVEKIELDGPDVDHISTGNTEEANRFYNWSCATVRSTCKK